MRALVLEFLKDKVNFKLYVVLCQENGHVKQREIAEFRQLLFSG